MLGHEIERTIGVSTGFTGKPKHCHRPGDDPRFTAILDEIDRAIAMRALKKYGHLSPVGLEKAAYDTEPLQAEGLERGDLLDFGLIDQDVRVARWRSNLKDQSWKDEDYHRLLRIERKEAEQILKSIS